MTHMETDYFRRREQQERAAAKAAGTIAARRLHQQMANHYSALLHGMTAIDPVPSLRVLGAL